MGLKPNQAQDVAHDAIAAVIVGSESAARGRHPRECDLANKEAFLSYLMGVVNSLVEAEKRRLENHMIREILDPSDDSVPGSFHAALASTDIHLEIAFADLGTELMRRLKAVAPKNLQMVISEWSLIWPWTDQIPVPTRQRRLRREVRRLAIQALRNLGEH